jgi:hypothetical protein
LQDFFRRRLSDSINCYRIVHGESAGFRAPQIFQMRSAAERFSDIVDIGTNIKAFAAQNGKIDIGQLDFID